MEEGHSAAGAGLVTDAEASSLGWGGADPRQVNQVSRCSVDRDGVRGPTVWMPLRGVDSWTECPGSDQTCGQGPRMAPIRGGEDTVISQRGETAQLGPPGQTVAWVPFLEKRGGQTRGSRSRCGGSGGGETSLMFVPSELSPGPDSEDTLTKSCQATG